jgi:hypothetical protein
MRTEFAGQRMGHDRQAGRVIVGPQMALGRFERPVRVPSSEESGAPVRSRGRLTEGSQLGVAAAY